MLIIIACLLGVLLLGGLTALVVCLIIWASKDKANRRGDDEQPSDGNKTVIIVLAVVAVGVLVLALGGCIGLFLFGWV